MFLTFVCVCVVGAILTHTPPAAILFLFQHNNTEKPSKFIFILAGGVECVY